MPLRLLALALLLSTATLGARAEPQLSIADTVFTGMTSEDGAVEAFLGIPFAQAPQGDFRWRSPQPPVYPPGRIAATQYKPACYQGDHMTRWYRGVVASFGGDPRVFPEPAVSEDCLYLNIWRPSSNTATSLPVLVYVHGGSNKGGWSYEPNYLGWQMARRDVVVVSIAYRVGPFGFFSHPQLKQANFALQDIIAALDWIKTHIPGTGGSAGNVTVMGESAGASNIAHLIAAPQARGLYHRLIHQSAGWSVVETASHAERAVLGAELQHSLGAESVEEMRQRSAQAVDESARRLFSQVGFDLVVDGDTLTSPLREILNAGELPPVDLLIGSNADEWRMYLDPQQTLAGWLQENLSPAQQARVRAALVEVEDEQQALDMLITAVNYVCPSRYLADRVSASGSRSWMYYFTRVREGEKAAEMGAYHGAELPYVFGTHDDWLPTTDEDWALSEAMMDYWASFARNGNPNHEGQPEWPAYGSAEQDVMQLDLKPRAIEHPSAALCAALDTTIDGDTE